MPSTPAPSDPPLTDREKVGRGGGGQREKKTVGERGRWLERLRERWRERNREKQREREGDSERETDRQRHRKREKVGWGEELKRRFSPSLQ